MALEATEEITRLSELVALYNSRQGKPAHSFQGLVVAGYLRALPRDPSGKLYVIDPSAHVRLNPRSAVDLSLLQ